jgi:hypothetical protein
MLKELTTATNGLLCLQGCGADAISTGSEACREAPVARMPSHDPRRVLHPRNRLAVEWLLLAVIWSGTLLLLSRTAAALAGIA